MTTGKDAERLMQLRLSVHEAIAEAKDWLRVASESHGYGRRLGALGFAIAALARAEDLADSLDAAESLR